jgi:mono/diheme cytochrome c family protein
MKNRMLVLIGVALIAAAGTAVADEVALGRVLYLQNCAPCHGLNAEGDGPGLAH